MPTKASKSSSAVATPDGDPILATESGDIVGHGLIKSLLARMIEERRLPQAVLFAGPPLLGKRSMAVVLGKRLLGSGVAPPVAKKSRAKTGEAHPTAAPDPLLSDGAVSRRVVRSCHLDFAVVRPEGGSKVVRIEQVRSLQDWAWLSPAEGPAKEVLIFGGASAEVDADSDQ